MAMLRFSEILTLDVRNHKDFWEENKVNIKGHPIVYLRKPNLAVNVSKRATFTLFSKDTMAGFQSHRFFLQKAWWVSPFLGMSFHPPQRPKIEVQQGTLNKVVILNFFLPSQHSKRNKYTFHSNNADYSSNSYPGMSMVPRSGICQSYRASAPAHTLSRKLAEAAESQC